MAKEKKHYKRTKSAGAESAGTVFGDVSNASTNYGMDKFSTPRGHGFAAERANHLYDKLHGKDAYIVGDDNKLDGPDRVVDGVNIQSKYCHSGSKCVSECFRDGKFRYFNADGTPMQVEVPSDKYEDAVKAMAERIKNGQVPGVTDPAKAREIIRKGNFTYEQAKNIAKAGTVESITFDAANGMIIAGYSFGISAALTFAVAVWKGEDLDSALKSAAAAGLKVGGTTFLTAVLASQLQKSALSGMFRASSDALVNMIGPKASQFLVNALRSGKNIYGAAAMKSASKLLRGNLVTMAASVVVLSAFDVANIFRGRISGSQLFKNLTNTTATVAGGTAGWVGGASAGAALGSVVPVIGTAVGGFIGGLVGSFVGGSAANSVSSAVLDEFIEDDAKEMMNIIESVFKDMADDYLISQAEAEEIVDELKEIIDGDTLKDMYAADYRRSFARELMEPIFEEVTARREKIILPQPEELQYGVRLLLENMADEGE